jgi:hypothetical protein
VTLQPPTPQRWPTTRSCPPPIAALPRSSRGWPRPAAEHWRTARPRCPFWTSPRPGGRRQMSQSRNIPQFGYDRHLRHSAVEHALAEPATGATSDPSGQPTRSPRSIGCVRSRSESREIGSGICSMPSHAHTSHGHRHRRHRPSQADQREHPHSARATVTHQGRTSHRHSCSVAATAWAFSCMAGKRPSSGGRASAWTTTLVVTGSWLRLTRALGGAARSTAARTSASGSPRAAARAPARAASTQATWAAAALTPHSATARTTTSAGNATAVSAVTEPRCSCHAHRPAHACRAMARNAQPTCHAPKRTADGVGARPTRRLAYRWIGDGLCGEPAGSVRVRRGEPGRIIRPG